MPTYEYECRSCEHQFEAFQSIKDKPLKKCPECGKGIRRLIGTGAAIIFRGSGFYQTDYRSEDYKKKAKAESASADSGDSSSKDTTKKAATKAKDSSTKSDS